MVARVRWMVLCGLVAIGPMACADEGAAWPAQFEFGGDRPVFIEVSRTQWLAP